jgi:hypothetical protein
MGIEPTPVRRQVIELALFEALAFEGMQTLSRLRLALRRWLHTRRLAMGCLPQASLSILNSGVFPSSKSAFHSAVNRLAGTRGGGLSLHGRARRPHAAERTRGSDIR